ncbi:hypothetical protein RND71_001680 [Anisodus tanguticus]|uniref:pectinesterase n=1 Tax=Anisodus tanguticus TaxID=243964 RepID=A0AAE1T1T9_9SOLA|nr:hypothetical protein RND71_001680 [Anisodus tanguticus]
MASAALTLLLFLISVQLPSRSCLSLQSGALDHHHEKDNGQLDVWISLNVKHYNRKRESSLKWMQESVKHKKQVPASASSSLDPKLRNAEMNKMIISASQDGSGNFQTIKEALASIPLYNKRRVILDIKLGIYSNPPRITGNDTASAAGTDGTPLKTFQSGTVSVDADYFVAINVIFENTASHVVGTAGEQAVALRISGNKAAVSTEVKTHFTITRAYTISTIASSKALLISSLAMADPSMRSRVQAVETVSCRNAKRVYYGEYRCSGPGANMTGRVPWALILTDEEAMPFIGTYYVDGNSWLIHP